MQIDPQTGKVRVVGWPKGVDTRRADFEVPDGYLREAVNVDVLATGNIRRRRGIAQAIADAGAHSVFSDGKLLVWATKDKLRCCGTDMQARTLLTDARLGVKPLSCVEVNGDIYFSSELINGKIVAGQYEPWGIVPPAVAPAVAPASPGTREYQVTCTFVTASGEESGAPLGAVVLCDSVPSMVVTAIPQSSDARVVATRLYVTNIDGGVFQRVADIPAGITSWVLTGFFAAGAKLRTQFNANPPPGQLVEYHNGRIYIAAGNVLWHTEALRYNIYDNTSGFFMFPERITMIKGVGEQGPRQQAGLYVSADRTYFLENAGTSEVKPWPKLPYRAIEGAACHLPDSPEVVWFSERGFVRGKAEGEVENLTEAQLAVPVYATGALGYTQFSGHRALVAMMAGGSGGYTAADYLAQQ